MPIAKNNSLVLILALSVISIFCIGILYKAQFFEIYKKKCHKNINKGLKNVLLEAFFMTPVLILLVYHFVPELLFYHLKTNFNAWVILWVIYPIFSAFPQEVIFRVFIFERYKLLLPNRNHRIILSCFTFAFLHIIFRNWQAVLISFLASLVFCFTYLKYRSVFLVTVEHSCFGLIAYTTGLGYYFDSSFID